MALQKQALSVSLDFELSVPIFKINLQKLKLIADGKD